MSLFRRRPLPSHELTFRTPRLGDLFMMRLTAFISETEAQVRAVDPTHAVLDLGGPSLGDRLLGRAFTPAVRLHLTFKGLTADESHSWNDQTEVHARIVARSRHSPEFGAMAKVVARELRGYFAAV